MKLTLIRHGKLAGLVTERFYGKLRVISNETLHFKASPSIICNSLDLPQLAFEKE